jgi:prevent-host-death family protein
MQKVGSRELKNRLGRYMSRVKRGESILVTDRGKPVAKLIPAAPVATAPPSVDDLLQRLEAQRRRMKPFKRRKLVPGRGKPASEMIIEDRR